METSLLQKLLAEGRPLLADGATGTNLFAMGLTSGESPELWNETHPDRIRALHQAFVDAGSDIVLTNSFGGNRRRLALHGAEGRVRELNRLAAENARAVADRAGRPVVVAGSVGPTGDVFAPLGPLTEDEAVEIFVEQIEGLREGGADVVWIETMSASEEIRAAARRRRQGRHALHRHGELRHRRADDDGRRARGFRRRSPAVSSRSRSAYGANCGVGAADLLVSILAMSEADPDAALIAKANAGVPHWRGAEIHYSGTPELMERLRRPRRRLRRADRRRLLRQHARPRRRHPARARRASSRRAPERRGDRRRARAARRARRRPRRRRAAAGASGHERGRRRACGARASGRRRPTAPAARTPLVAGRRAAGVRGRRRRRAAKGSTGSWAARPRTRRLALSRTRIKALIEAGEVSVDGETARDPATRRRRGRAHPLRGRRRRRTLRSRAKTSRSTSSSRTSI